MKKGLLPALRKKHRLTAPECDGGPEESPVEERPRDVLMKYHHASRSLDETSDSPFTSKERRNIPFTPPRSYSDDAQHDGQRQDWYYSDSDKDVSHSPDTFRRLKTDNPFAFHRAKPNRRGKLKQQECVFDGPNQGGSPPISLRMVDQEDITTLTRHVRNFSLALKELRDSFLISEDYECQEDIQSLAHNKLGEVVSILKGVIQRYPTLNPTEILTSAGIVIKKVKEHDYSSLDEPNGFFEAIDQLALAFSNSVSDYLEEDLSQRVGHTHPDLTGTEVYDDFDDKRNFSEIGGDLSEFYDENSERAESEESLDKIECDVPKRLSLNFDSRDMTDGDHERAMKQDLSVARAEELDKSLISLEGSVDMSLQRTKVWSKYAKDIISYMERRAHIESDYCKQLTKLALATKAVITEESYLPFQSTYVTALEYDINFAKKCQEKLQQELRGKIIEQLTQRRNEHDRIRSKLKEKWHKECKRLNDSVTNLKKSKSLYIQKQQELKKFVDKQEKEDGSQSSSVVPSFSIGKKKKEEDIAKRAEEAEDYYKKCVEEANVRQIEVENTRESVLLELRQLVYQCDMTMRAVTHGYFQMMEQLAAHLPQQYSALAKDSKQSEVGKQFAEYIKLQQTTSKKTAPIRFSFDTYQADDRTDAGEKGYIGPADYLSASHDHDLTDQKESPNVKRISRRISSASMGSDTSLNNRPSSPVPTKKPQNAWVMPNRYSNSDDTASVSSRSLPGSPAASPGTARKENSQRLSLSNTDIDVRVEMKKNLAGPFRNLKMSKPAKTHKFKKLRSSSKCKKCDSYVYFNGAECELCGLTSHKKCLETLAIQCGKSRLPRKMTTFGVDFQKHLAATKRQDIPIIMEKCITEIDLRCLHCKGIYRVSGVKTKVEALSQQFEIAGSAVDLQSTNPNLITSVLKLYLRELPEPLMTFDLYPDFIQIAKDSTGLKFDRPENEDINNHNEENDRKCEDILKRLHESVLRLPHANYFTVLRLFKHLRRVANNEEFNQMSCNNLAIIFGPTLLRPRGSPSSLSALMDMSHQVRVVELLLMNTQILDEDFGMEKTIEEEKVDDGIDPEIDAKNVSKRSQSTQSEQDLGYNTQPDQLDDGKQELSLSDELQVSFPDIFNRVDGNGRDFGSLGSLGSLDSVPDMSPDIDEELQDIVLRNRPPDRPKSLDFGDNEKLASPPNLRSGSESNISIGSMSPIELPDSSVDLKKISSKRSTEIICRTRTEDEPSTNRAPDSGHRARRSGKVAIESTGILSQTNEALDNGIEGNVDDVDHFEGGTRADQLPSTSDAPEKVDSAEESSGKVVRTEGLLDPELRMEESLNEETISSGTCGKSISISISIGNDSVEVEENAAEVGSRLKEGELERCENVTGKPAPDESVIDRKEMKVQNTRAVEGPLTITMSSSSRSKKGVAVVVSDNGSDGIPKTPPKVAPKPSSPVKSLELSIDYGDQETEHGAKASSVKKDNSQDSESDIPLNISGNTKKLRDRFIAESEAKDERRVSMERGVNREGQSSPFRTPVSQSSGDSQERPPLIRSHSNTAKLVEKFTKEVERKIDTREDSSLAQRNVSVKEMLKQFESGDEMEDNDAQTPSKTSGPALDKSSLPSNSVLSSGSASLPRDQRPPRQIDEKTRSTSDLGQKREPKFV